MSEHTILIDQTDVQRVFLSIDDIETGKSVVIKTYVENLKGKYLRTIGNVIFPVAAISKLLPHLFRKIPLDRQDGMALTLLQLRRKIWEESECKEEK